MRFLIVSGGEATDEFVENVIKRGGYDVILAADSGMDFLYRTKILQDIIVGDFDSVDPEVLEFFREHAAHTTGRFLDATLSYRFQNEKFPLLLSWSTVVFGRDRNSNNTKQKYSTFAYAEYPIYQKDGWKVDAGVGGAFALNRAGEDAHFFGTTAGIVHVSLQASHDLKLGNYTIPVYAKGMWNPQSNESYFQKIQP